MPMRMRAFRIADRRFPIFDGAGARLAGGRWNSPGRGVIYAAETFAGAMLEVLAHAGLGRIPKTLALVEITISDRVAVEAVLPAVVPGWNATDYRASRTFGDAWLEQRRSAVLLVPSVVTGGRERDVLLNPDHPDFRYVAPAEPQAVVWDERLFAPSRPLKAESQ